MQVPDLGAHLHAQLGVQVGQRLVEQEHPRVTDHCATHGNPLALSPGQLAGVPIHQDVEPERLGDGAHSLVDLILLVAVHLQAEAQILPNRLVRIECIALEHHRHVAVTWSQVVHDVTADLYRADIHLLQPGDQSQQGRLAAARRADEHAELLVGDRQVDVLQHFDRAEGLREIGKSNRGHSLSLLPSGSASRGSHVNAA